MDERARLTHLFDQASGVLHDIAPRLRAYYRELTTGPDAIPAAQAILLVRDIQARFVGEANTDETEDW